MPDAFRPARRAAACLPLLGTLIGTGLLALALVWGWHLLAPERWHWLSADERGGLEAAGLGLVAAAVALHALMRRTGACRA